MQRRRRQTVDSLPPRRPYHGSPETSLERVVSGMPDGFMSDRNALRWAGGEPVRPGDSVSDTIARFSPDKVDEATWARIGPTVRDWATRSAPETPYRARTLMSVLAQLALWADTIGLGLDADTLLHPDTLDRFVVEGMVGYTSGTRLNYRRHLRCVGAVVLGRALYPPAPLPIHRESVLPPYSPPDITRLLAWVRGLPTERFRHDAGGMISLGLGAGLTSQEQSRLVGTDISADQDGVLVAVIGKQARVVPVLAEWEGAVADLGAQAGDGPVLLPERTRISRHQLKNFLARCPQGDAPVLDTGRLRATWICHHLAAGTDVRALEAGSGVRAEQLVKYRVHLPTLDPEVTRRALRGASAP